MKPELSTHVMTSRRRGSGHSRETEVLPERKRKGRDRDRERTTQATKLKRKLFVTAKRVYYFGTLSNRDHTQYTTPVQCQGRAAAGEQDNGQCARKESAKFYICLAGWLALWPQDPRTCHRPKPFLIKMLTGAAKNADTLDGANRERERENPLSHSNLTVFPSRIYFLFLIDLI